MAKTREITMMQMREKLGQYADEVFYTKTPILVTRKNRVIVEIMPPGAAEIIEKQKREESFKVFDRIRNLNKNIPSKKLDKIINEAVREVKKQEIKEMKQKNKNG